MWLPCVVLFLPLVVNAILPDFVLDFFRPHCSLPDDIHYHCGTNSFQNEVSMCRLMEACPKEYLGMNECCRYHDRCYECSFGKSREYCDDAFYLCMKKAAVYRECRNVAKQLYDFVDYLGAPFFNRYC